MIDQHLVKNVIHSFLLLGLDESFDVYKEHLEKPFLDATGKHYEREREPFLAEGTLPDNLRRAEERVKEEDRMDRYLRTETREHLVCVLVRYQMAVLLQYNAHDTLSLEELIATTSISKENLSQVLMLLVKPRL